MSATQLLAFLRYNLCHGMVYNNPCKNTARCEYISIHALIHSAVHLLPCTEHSSATRMDITYTRAHRSLSKDMMVSHGPKSEAVLDKPTATELKPGHMTFMFLMTTEHVEALTIKHYKTARKSESCSQPC